MYLGFSSMNTPRDPSSVELARALEERGFESLWIGEHSHIPVSRLSPYPGGGELPEPYKSMMDPYISLAAAAMVTKTLKLATGIALLMERDVFSQAKTIATLDRLSGGRVMIGAGIGWNREEFENTSHLPWDKRYGVLREVVAATRVLWTEDEPEYHGDHIDFDPVWCSPKPEQPGGPAIIFGAMGPLGMRHAAQWADGWMPVDIGLGNIRESIAAFRDLVTAAGRSHDDVPITVQTMISPTLDDLLAYRDMGVSRVIVGVAVDQWDQPEAIMPLMDRIAAMIPQVQ